MPRVRTARAPGSRSPFERHAKRARLAKGVAALARDENLEYARQVRVYDTVTDNGRAQSQGPAFGFPGGPNANAYCPL